MLSFAIGTHKPKKLSKKEKVKRLSKKAFYSPTVNSPTVNNVNNIPAIRFTLPKLSFSFNRETWRIPGTIYASSSVESKFINLNHIFSYRKIVTYIKDSLVRIRFKFPQTNEQFEVPKEIRSQITSYYAKQENEWNKVRGIYLRLFRFKQYIAPLIYNWKVNTAKKNIKNVEDPVTLEVPRKPICVIDIKRKMSFVYDAKTLRKTIEGRLLFSDYMFAEPLEPVNLLTNESLTYGQLISIFRQCREFGEYSWALDEFKINGFNLKKFTTFNRQRLNLEAINVFFKKSIYIMRETVIDFFLTEADLADLPTYKVNAFVRKYDELPTCYLVQKWIINTKEYYIAKELNDPALLKKNDIDTDKLLNSIYLSTL